jgi:hypothetical protein
MKYEDIINGIDLDTINILGSHHISKQFFLNTQMRDNPEHWKDMLVKYSEKIAAGIDIESNQKMWDIYNHDLNKEYQPGDHVRGYTDCKDCGKTIHLIYISDNTLFFCESDILKKNGYHYKYTMADVTECTFKEHMKTKKLVSRIQVPTGKLIFQDRFNKKELYSNPNGGYGSNSIESINGRYELMKYLATQNVGYGQMTNTMIYVYSNKKDEIIIAECGVDEIIESKKYYELNPFEEEDVYFKKDYKKAKPLIDYLQANNFEKVGYVSCDVWRWMCADQSVLDLHDEEINENNSTVALVEAGTWEVEHYYDFNKKDFSICSKLKKVSD